jgi:hypothetical protein
MAFSKVKILNIALCNLGISAPIQNSYEESPTAILMNNYYDLARDTVLEAHDWSFANATVELSVSALESDNPNYFYAYHFPNDCVAPRAIIDNLSKKEKKFESAIDSKGGKIILTNCTPCTLRYTKRVTNETLFTAAFVNALAFYLAYLSAQVVTGSANKKNTNLQDYQVAIRQAIVTDARKTETQDEDDKDFTDFR